MSDQSASAMPVGADAALPLAAPPSAWRRFVDCFVPAGERHDALWIIGVATLLACVRALAYQPLQSFVTARVYSPGANELGFALRATAIADVAWGVFAGVFILLVLRFTKAPRVTALYIVAAGVLVAVVTLGNRLALNAVMALAGSEYQRSTLSDLQPMMLAAAEAVGVAIAAWAAQLLSGEEKPADGSTLLPALGWSGTPLLGAAWLAAFYVAVRVVGQLAATMVMFAPQAYTIFSSVKDLPSGLMISWPGLFGQAAVVAIYVLIGYFGVKRYGAPVTIWLALFAAGIPGIISALAFLPSQYAVAAASGGGAPFWAAGLGVLGLVSWPLSALPPLLGVWLATRRPRASQASDTLPAQDNDHW